ncbi:MAG: GNAT family N-acetyltransferase [Duodenibacillus sp.]|nr:GNAT family N-acetyltransferase [Duodenibacillus sp.]
MSVTRKDEAIRQGRIEDAAALAAIEALCFPPAEAASREAIAARLIVYPSHFWVLERAGAPVGFADGMVIDSEVIDDAMYADASLHNEAGDWQAVFGLNVMPGHRHQGCAGRLIEAVIAQARAEGRRGVVLTCKDALVHYYQRFGFKSLGASASTHGGAAWNDMILRF